MALLVNCGRNRANAIALFRMISGQSKVAREFEFTLLRQRVFSFRDSLPLLLKNAHLAGIRHPKSTGEPVSSGFKREFRRFLSVCTFGGGLSVKDSAFYFEQKKDAAGPLLIGGGSGRRRKSEGPLLRRPARGTERGMGREGDVFQRRQDVAGRQGL